MIKTKNSNLSERPVPKPKFWLLAKSRQWHTWGGLIAGIFLLIVGASGIVLNYKQPIFNALGLEQGPPPKANGERGGKVENAGQASSALPEKVSAPRPRITTQAGIAGIPVSFEHALEIAREEWGNVQLERIELKEERGELIYKLKQKKGDELWVNATTGSHFIKGEYERMGKAGADGVAARTTDWGKIILDLHTGKIGGEAGKAVMSFASLLLLLLTLSGVYMWMKPILIRRGNAKTKARAANPIAPATPTPAPAREQELAEA